MLSALGENLPPSCHWSKPDGGLYIWLELPPTADAALLQNKAAEEEDIRYLSGDLFSTSGQGRNCLRLCYGYNTTSEITEGIGLLARFFNKEGTLQ
jgi:DNA-binding transcriptional MocR family regulator